MSDETAVPKKSEPDLIDMLARDTAIAVGALAAWGGAEAWASGSGSGLTLALIVAVAAAIIAGWLLATLAHEWGHYLGAKLLGAKAPRVRVPGNLFVRYNFDLAGNSRAQFNAMSIGGSVLHWGVFAAALMLVPTDTLAATALIASVFAFAIFASAIEWPIITRVSLGRVAPKDAFVGLTLKVLRRYQVVGVLAGVGLFLWI